ncbi:hypothetical protein ACIOGZ_41225 [Kitasatospora sp. NPDC088160]|uniref:hypothetical protein n=1 Tax=Kitasatospora sp. NPDC088160 TaxID=3364072 RepID=UPI0038075DCB
MNDTAADEELSDSDVYARLHRLLTEIDKADYASDRQITAVLFAALHFCADFPSSGGMQHVYRTTYGLLVGPGAHYRDTTGDSQHTAVRSVRRLAGRIVAQSVANDLAAHPLFGHRYPMREAVEKIIRYTWEQHGSAAMACLALHREATAWSEELREAGLHRTVQVLASAAAGDGMQALCRQLCMYYATTYSHGRGRALGAALHRVILLSKLHPAHAANVGYARKPRQVVS